MPKFNLQDYKKINGDEHIDARLQEQHGNIPNEINEKQLENYRTSEPDETIEGMLEKVRTGSADRITEGRLDTEKSKFKNKFRNKEAYSGNMGKLEEKRLQNDPVEKEKAKVNTQTPKKLRWWEDSSSPDGLKLASEKRTVKTAQEDDENYSDVIENVVIPEEEKKEEDFSIVEDPISEIIKEEKEAQDPTESAPRLLGENQMDLIHEKIFTGKIPGIYMVFQFDPEKFNDSGDIRKNALKEALSIHPELGGLIDTSDFYELNMDDGTIKLRGIGEKFNILEAIENSNTEPEIEGDKNLFTNIGVESKNIDGTPMYVGTIKVNKLVDEDNEQDIIDRAVEYISNINDIQIDPRSLDTSKLLIDGVITYVGAKPPMEQSEEKEEFNISDVSNATDMSGVTTAQNIVSKKK